MIRTKRARLLLLAAPVLLAFLALLLAGCGGHSETAARDDRAPVAVRVTVVGPGETGDGLVLPGRVEAREEVTLASRVSGRITTLPVAEGGSFHEGDLLAAFDAPEAREALAAADAAWRSASTSLSLARRQEARIESLYTARVAALHEFEVVRADRERAEAAERGASAALAERRAAVEMRAPFAGVVVRHRVDRGADVAPGSPLLDIRSRESGLVVTSVPENAEGAISGPASIQIGDGPWRPAKLVRADGMIDPMTRSRTARYRPLDVGAMEPGAFARVRLGAGAATKPGRGKPAGEAADAGGAWNVPTSALVTRGALQGVYVIRDGRATLRWLRVGRAAGAQTPVLAGLDPGDSVALDPAGLEDGRRAEAAR